MGEQSVATVEIPIDQEVEVQQDVITVKEAEEIGLDSEEIDLGKKQGIIGEVKKPEDQKKVEEQKKKADDQKPDIVERLKKGEEITPEEEHEELGKLDKKGQAYYFQMKNERKKRQDAVNERDLLKVKVAAAEKELETLKAVKKVTKPDDDLDLLNLDENGNVIEKEKPKDEYITKADLEARDKEKEEKDKIITKEREELVSRLSALEVEAKAKDPENYEYIIKLATEVMEKDKTNLYAQRFFLKAIDLEPKDGITAIDFAYTLAKLHPDYKANGGKEKKEGDGGKEKQDINKIIEHANRKSSAGIGGGGNKIISEDDLELSDAARISQAQWNKLSAKTRERILRETS